MQTNLSQGSSSGEGKMLIPEKNQCVMAAQVKPCSMAVIMLHHTGHSSVIVICIIITGIGGGLKSGI